MSEANFAPEVKEWPRYCRKVYWTTMVQNGYYEHLGQNDPIMNRIDHSRDKNSPFWFYKVHVGPFGSANRTVATTETCVLVTRGHKSLHQLSE